MPEFLCAGGAGETSGAKVDRLVKISRRTPWNVTEYFQ
jgi:hypothetical protein